MRHILQAFVRIHVYLNTEWEKREEEKKTKERKKERKKRKSNHALMGTDNF